MPHPGQLVFTLSPFQAVALLVIAIALVAVVAFVGFNEGRFREACEPTKKPTEDDGGGLGARVRGHR